MTNQNHHILLIACPAQGHINPTLQFAKCLSRAGLRVTFATTANALRWINFPSNLDRLSLASFTTGFDDGVKPSDDPRHVAEESRRMGSKSIHDLIISLSNQDRPISLLIYTLMLPWAADVAHELHVPSVFLCSQSAVAFAIYKHYFNFNGDNKRPPSCIELQGLPLFEPSDLPTFLLPSSPHYFVLPTLEDHIRAIERDTNPTILVNTFDALEEPVIRAVNHQHHNVKMITIGPLIPSAFSDGSDPSDTSYGCDLFQSSRDYLSWLGLKADKSVVYVSFGTMIVIKRKFFEEILHGLVLTRRPYLWVIRPITHYKMVGDDKDEVVIEDILKNGLGPIGGPEDQGLIVPWCSQVEVLSHPAIGCFLTHCGWNSILESLVNGVSTVGVPLISDQPTNAKMVEKVWCVGLRAKVNEEGVVNREEVKRCVEVVMGDEESGREIRHNTKKWMDLALDAMVNGGSSKNNLKYFLQDLQNSQLLEENVKKEGILENNMTYKKGLVEKVDLIGKII